MEAALNEFEKLVFEMRSTQRRFFQTKNREHLKRAKELEKKVDKMLFEKIEYYYNPKLDL